MKQHKINKFCILFLILYSLVKSWYDKRNFKLFILQGCKPKLVQMIGDKYILTPKILKGAFFRPKSHLKINEAYIGNLRS